MGGAGYIFRYVPDGVDFVNELQTQVPNKFILEQNYPNPSNPGSSIQYAIISRQFVTIKVYDAFGNEITTLVNEEKPVGSYNAEFRIQLGNIFQPVESRCFFLI